MPSTHGKLVNPSLNAVCKVLGKGIYYAEEDAEEGEVRCDGKGPGWYLLKEP